jgi:hypothetical protein
MEIGHPDEPGEPLASFLSDVVAIDSGAQFWADIIDMEEQPIVLERLLAAVVDAVSLVVTAAHLSSRLDS